MTDSNVTGRARRDLMKFRITFGVSLAVLVLAGALFYLAFNNQGDFLNTGDRLVVKAIRSGALPVPANIQEVHRDR